MPEKTDINPSMSRSDEHCIQSILSLWFVDEASGRMDLPQSRRWFGGGEQLDQMIRETYSQTLEDASAGVLDHWQHSAHGALSLIIVLDQFSRNVHRKSAKAFACDSKALTICKHALSMKYPSTLPLTQQVFLYLPLEHDESAQSQQLCVTLFEELVDRAPAELVEFARRTLDYAREHKAIIDRFGRFPHRNKALGRQDTDDEIRWLSDGGKRFGQ